MGRSHFLVIGANINQSCYTNSYVSYSYCSCSECFSWGNYFERSVSSNLT